MEGEKLTRIQSLNQAETEVLHVLFKDPNFKVKELAATLYKSEQAIRGNLTAIYDKLGVPDNVENKREWVVSEYQETYEYVFQRELWESRQAAQRLNQEPEMFIHPPDPIIEVLEPPEPDSEVKQELPPIIVNPPRFNYSELWEELHSDINEILEEKMIVDKKEQKQMVETRNVLGELFMYGLFTLVGIALGFTIGINWPTVLFFLNHLFPAR